MQFNDKFSDNMTDKSYISISSYINTLQLNEKTIIE